VEEVVAVREQHLHGDGGEQAAVMEEQLPDDVKQQHLLCQYEVAVQG
jgi:hypothetical protein